MPQVMDGTSKCSKINERLRNRSAWPILCTRLWPMPMPLCARDNSREGGEGIPDCFMLVANEVGVQKLSRCLERQKL